MILMRFAFQSNRGEEVFENEEGKASRMHEVFISTR